jgi:hypothetical protein
MCQHETKNCPRCKTVFECKPGNITQCQCYGIELTAELKAYIEQRYSDCLCKSCLQYLQQELNLFKEKYLFK